MEFAIISNGIVEGVYVCLKKPVLQNKTVIDVTGMENGPGPGWSYADDIFSPPAAIPKTTITSLNFWNRLTNAEQEALIASNNAKVQRLLFEMRLRPVLPVAKLTIILNAMELAGLLAPGRAAEILA
jgi:hypothetical protein